MCGRYTLTRVDPNVLGPLFEVFEIPPLLPRYNIAPTQLAPVIRVLAPNAPRTLSMASWGLVPSWAKETSIGSKMINARSETAAEKPSFRSSFKSKRCLVPADGFFEWKKQKTGKKQPCWIHAPDGLPFAFAGLWAHWEDSASGEVLESFTILTQDSTGPIAEVHDRMPVVLPKDAYRVWLDPNERSVDTLVALLRDRTALDAVVTEVSTYVNNPRHDHPDNIRPVAPVMARLPGFG